ASRPGGTTVPPRSRPGRTQLRARFRVRSAASPFASQICNPDTRRGHSLTSAARLPDHLTSAAVEIHHLDRFAPDAEDAITALDDIPFLPGEWRTATAIAEDREPLRLARRLDHAEKLQGDRWRRRWHGWTGRHGRRWRLGARN